MGLHFIGKAIGATPFLSLSQQIPKQVVAHGLPGFPYAAEFGTGRRSVVMMRWAAFAASRWVADAY